MQKVYYHEHDATLAKPWKHLDYVSKGEVMAFLGNERTLTAPDDGYIILPKGHAKPGDEWFYFGIEASFPASLSLSEMDSHSPYSFVPIGIQSSPNAL